MRTLLVSVVLVLALAASSFAANGGFQGAAPGNPGGFQGPSSQAGINTVKGALSARDDTPVVLTGHIVQRLAGDHEHYLFQDGTGQIMVDIDDDLFMGRTVTPQTTIRIYGEVDRELMERTRIDVKSLEIL